MSGRYLLDTNIVIGLMKNEDLVLRSFANAEEVFLCATMAGELYFGAAKSGRPQANMVAVNEFLQGATNLVTVRW